MFHGVKLTDDETIKQYHLDPIDEHDAKLAPYNEWLRSIDSSFKEKFAAGRAADPLKDAEVLAKEAARAVLTEQKNSAHLTRLMEDPRVVERWHIEEQERVALDPEEMPVPHFQSGALEGMNDDQWNNLYYEMMFGHDFTGFNEEVEVPFGRGRTPDDPIIVKGYSPIKYCAAYDYCPEQYKSDQIFFTLREGHVHYLRAFDRYFVLCNVERVRQQMVADVKKGREQGKSEEELFELIRQRMVRQKEILSYPSLDEEWKNIEATKAAEAKLDQEIVQICQDMQAFNQAQFKQRYALMGDLKEVYDSWSGFLDKAEALLTDPDNSMDEYVNIRKKSIEVKERLAELDLAGLLYRAGKSTEALELHRGDIVHGQNKRGREYLANRAATMQANLDDARDHSADHEFDLFETSGFVDTATVTAIAEELTAGKLSVSAAKAKLNAAGMTVEQVLAENEKDWKEFDRYLESKRRGDDEYATVEEQINQVAKLMSEQASKGAKQIGTK
jgi:hypothetical protein